MIGVVDRHNNANYFLSEILVFVFTFCSEQIYQWAGI